MTTKKILLLSAVLITLAACNNVDRQECWKAKNTSLSKDCNSGGSSALSKNTPNIKVKDKKNKSIPDNDTPETGGETPGTDTGGTDTGGTNQNDPGPANPSTPDPDTNNDNPSPNEDTNVDTNEDTNTNPPNQNNSNDIEGYDPFDNVYGPGT